MRCLWESAPQPWTIQYQGTQDAPSDLQPATLALGHSGTVPWHITETESSNISKHAKSVE